MPSRRHGAGSFDIRPQSVISEWSRLTHFVGSLKAGDGVFGVVSMVTRHLTQSKVSAKVDFIFDQQSGVSSDVPLFFEYMTRSLPKAARKMISGIPQFRDDEDAVALQAADMLAWHLRRDFEKGDVDEQLNALWWAGSGHLVTHFDRQRLERIGRGFAKIPHVMSLQTKPQWRGFRANLASVQANGFVPPKGSWWKNMLFELHQKVRWLFLR